jgi:hypothetical protein
MQQASLILLYGALALPLLGPVIVGFFVSLAFVGAGLRSPWALIALPTYFILVVIFSVLFGFVSNSYTQTMWSVASAFLASAALSPLAIAFRRRAHRIQRAAGDMPASALVQK